MNLGRKITHKLFGPCFCDSCIAKRKALGLYASSSPTANQSPQPEVTLTDSATVPNSSPMNELYKELLCVAPEMISEGSTHSLSVQSGRLSFPLKLNIPDTINGSAVVALLEEIRKDGHVCEIRLSSDGDGRFVNVASVSSFPRYVHLLFEASTLTEAVCRAFIHAKRTKAQEALAGNSAAQPESAGMPTQKEHGKFADLAKLHASGSGFTLEGCQHNWQYIPGSDQAHKCTKCGEVSGK